MAIVEITRRTRLMASVDYTPGIAPVEDCHRMTPGQIMALYHEHRRSNPNASVFVTLYKNGRRLSWHSHQLEAIVDKSCDEIHLEVANV